MSTVLPSPSSIIPSNSTRVSLTVAPPWPSKTRTTAWSSNESASLASTASATQRREPATSIPVGGEIVERQTCPSGSVPEHRIVEVRATERVEAHRVPDELDAAIVLDPHESGVERPAAQVVHGEQGPGLERALDGVVPRRRLRLADQPHVAPAGSSELARHETRAVKAPRRRDRHAELGRPFSLAFGDAVDDPGHHQREQLLGGEAPVARTDGRRVTDAPLELADEAFGLRRCHAARPRRRRAARRRRRRPRSGPLSVCLPSGKGVGTTSSSVPNRAIAAAVRLAPTSTASTNDGFVMTRPSGRVRRSRSKGGEHDEVVGVVPVGAVEGAGAGDEAQLRARARCCTPRRWGTSPSRTASAR